MKASVSARDFEQITVLGGLTLSPDGKKVFFTAKKPSVAENSYKLDAYLYDGSLRHLPFSASAIFEDDETLLFTERKREITLCHRTDLNGQSKGDFSLPFPATQLCPLGGGLYLCLGNRRIASDNAFASDTEKLHAEAQTDDPAEQDDADYETLEEVPFWRNGAGFVSRVRQGLFLCDTVHHTQRLLTAPLYDVRGLQLGADGTEALFFGRAFERICPEKMNLNILDTRTLSVRQIADDAMRIDFAAFAGRDTVLAVRTQDSVSPIQVHRIDALSGACTVIEADLQSGLASGDVMSGGGFHCDAQGLYYNGMKTPYRTDYRLLSPDGKRRVLADEVDQITAGVGCKGAIYFFGAPAQGGFELYRKTAEGIEKLTSFNEAYFANHRIARCEHYTVQNRQGMELDGFLLYPEGKVGEHCPGILAIHGGPCSFYGDVFVHELQYLSALGYAVFFTNPRGSSGKEIAFQRIQGENYQTYAYEDLMDFTDATLRRFPFLDEERLGVFGGSYGGYMVNWIVGHTQRFKAAVSCRSASNRLTDMLTGDSGYYHMPASLLTTPWQDPGFMWDCSPLKYADRVKTPILLIQSDEDSRCFAGHAMEFLSALLLNGAEAKLFLIHGENHGLSSTGKPRHRLRRLEEIGKWFKKYISTEAP